MYLGVTLTSVSHPTKRQKNSATGHSVADPDIGSSPFRTSILPVGAPVGINFPPRPLIYIGDSSAFTRFTSAVHLRFADVT
ncbi:hypothetical protein HAX54_027556 [Datura stramonium]|uniref:Uncharacterized protein n=1 Tax=Datura stramonium TaxID=4076 RepID=A0ABS8V3V6_DATST|nr:hypothetical protein [Datura stramonium]